MLSNKIQFHQPEKIGGKLFHHRRELMDGELIFLVNTSSEEWSTGSFALDGKSVVEFNLVNGEITPYPAKKKSNGNNNVSISHASNSNFWKTKSAK